MVPGKLLQRNVRPQRIYYDDDIEDDEGGQSGGDNADSESDEDLVDSDVEGHEKAGPDEGMSEPSEESDAEVQDQIKNVSFGALKQAQDTLSRKRKRGSNDTLDQEDKLEALRERLRQIKKDKQRTSSEQKRKTTAASQKAARQSADHDSDDSNSDSAPSEADAPTRARTSKHAPTSQTSKRQVTRRRQVVEVPNRHIRDPRFDAIRTGVGAGAASNPHATHNSERAYAFLEDYQKSEIAELQAALKRARTDDDRDTLRRKLVSMQNTLKTKAARERERDVVRKHRAAEREAVREGKNPYFLKRGEVRERALVEKFKGMKGKEREKVMEKKRLKESQREKRRMPEGRRRVG